MEIRHISYPLAPDNGSASGKAAIAIGDFDGVHLGHRNVIHHALHLARKLEIGSAIMTFDPHPREVLGQSTYSRYLTPLPVKLELFRELGVEMCYVVRFDKSFARVSPDAFVEHMLAPLGLHTAVVGFDFTFGHKGQGTVETLKELCSERFGVDVVRPYHLDGDKVSSTLIREQIHVGNLHKAKRYLGRYYTLGGTVVQGEQRGRTIGFPTANLDVAEPYVIPSSGVYAVWVRHCGRRYQGVMNIGVKPTFHQQASVPVLEVHLLDFSGNLYGEQLTVEFVSYLRREMKFPSVDALVAQIREDAVQAGRALESE